MSLVQTVIFGFGMMRAYIISMNNLTYNTKIRELEIEAVRQGVESQLLTALVTLAYEFGMFVERKKRPLTFDEMLKNNSDFFKNNP